MDQQNLPSTIPSVGPKFSKLVCFQKRLKICSSSIVHTVYTAYNPTIIFKKMYMGEQRASKSFLGNKTFPEGFLGPEPRNLLKDLWSLNLKVFWRICGHWGLTIINSALDHKQEANNLDWSIWPESTLSEKECLYHFGIWVDPFLQMRPGFIGQRIHRSTERRNALLPTLIFETEYSRAPRK